MRSSAAIFILALATFAIVFANAQVVAASDDVSKIGSRCYSKYGLSLSSSFCDSKPAAASLPKVNGSGPFANCVVESTLRLLETDAVALEFDASGKFDTTLAADVAKINGVKVRLSQKPNPDGPGVLYQIVFPPDGQRYQGTQRDVTIVREGGRITSMSARTYDLTSQGRSLDVSSVATTKMKFSYPNGKCQVDRIDLQLPSFPDVTQYDRGVCSAVNEYASAHKSMAPIDLDTHLKTFLTAYANDPARSKAALFAFDQRVGKLPSIYPRMPVPLIVSICKKSGAGLAATTSVHKPVNLLPPSFHSGD